MISALTSPLKVAVAGSSQYTKLMAEVLQADPRFTLTWILTPTPKPIGRKQILTQNPLHEFGLANHLPCILINQKIDAEIKTQLAQLPQPDFLLVVDFGYLVPDWLLELPQIAPVNIHPSALPRWRGSSPGQMVILTGETTSAVSLMKLNANLDQGEIIQQLKFKVLQHWNSQDYYDFSFQLISQTLGQALVTFAQDKQAQAQPLTSPTPISKRLNKTDSFINWSDLYQLLSKEEQKKLPSPQATTPNFQPRLLNNYLQQTPVTQKAELIARACLAFSPWPGLWTIIATKKGDKRLKIIACHVEQEQLSLDEVQLEGKNPGKINEIKNWFS